MAPSRPLSKTSKGTTSLIPSESGQEIQIHAEATENPKKASGWMITLGNEEGPIYRWVMTGPDPREGKDWHKIMKLVNIMKHEIGSVSTMWRITVTEIGIITLESLQDRVEKAVVPDLMSKDEFDRLLGK